MLGLRRREDERPSRLHPHRVDRSDLQGNILAAYGNRFPVALYAFLKVDDAARARHWLGVLVPFVTTATPWPRENRPSFTLNVAFSCNGLRALQLPEPLLETFPHEFRAGMASRCERLGDIGDSRPRLWEFGPEEPDVLVTLYGIDEDALERAWEAFIVRGTQTGAVARVYEQAAALLGDPNRRGLGREHFGYADGFGQPTIKGNAGPWDRPGGGTPTHRNCWSAVAPGEFVLGYPSEDGTVAQRPGVSLRRSGTYTVVRKLHQNVAAFTQYLRKNAGGNPASQELLAARIVGRWRDGTPLEVSPDRPIAALAADYGPGGAINDFRYRDDLDGLRCPLGAHVRRANPRDALAWKARWFRPDGRLTKRHRIIRRGMPYGRPPADAAKHDGRQRGLMFVCHQASIERQFEVIQGQWLNDGDAFWLGTQRDLLTSGRKPSPKRRTGMIVQGRPPIFLPEPSEPLVTTRGGGYFFTPGINALRTLSAGGWL